MRGKGSSDKTMRYLSGNMYYKGEKVEFVTGNTMTDNEVCKWKKTLIFNDVIEEGFYTACRSADLVSLDKGWVYCPWCGKKIEVNE